jgi:LPXTG-site transpeptidase (sortase) family protein
MTFLCLLTVVLIWQEEMNSHAPSVAPVVVVNDAPVETAPKPEPTPSDCYRSNNPAYPYLISIPAAGIENACLEMVGVKEDAPDQLGDPSDVMAMGYYIGSERPGDSGVGVYICHRSFATTVALCNDLPTVQAGDAIVLENAEGVKFNYKITEVETVARQSVDMADFLTQVSRAAEQGVNLVTCVGSWDAANQTGTHRLIVKAILE